MKRLISLLLTVVLSLSFALTAFAHPFTDVRGHWAESEIDSAFAAGIINGDGNGSFRPNSTVTRAEFAKMLVASILEPSAELLGEATALANQGNLTHWFAPYSILSIYSEMFYFDQENSVKTKDGVVFPGIVEIASDDNKTFPGVSTKDNSSYRIERWEMAFMMYLVTEALTDNPNAALAVADDQTTAYPQSVQDAVSYCVYNNIMRGDLAGNLNLAGCGTRAEAVALVNRIHQFVRERSLVLNQEAEKAAGIKVKTYPQNEIPTKHVKVLFTLQNGKTFTMELYPEYAPQTVANFVALVNAGFYNGLTFHRVIDNFMAQGGDPEGNGTGGAGFNIYGEFKANNWDANALSHTDGVVSMARGDLFNSASCQFFICFGDQSFLDGNYAAFGKVISGLDHVKAFTKVERTENESGELAIPKKPIIIKSAKVIK